MDKLNKEYMEILGGNGTPSEKFWKLEKRIKEDAYKKIEEAKNKIDLDGSNFTAVAEEMSDSDQTEVEVTCHTNEKAYRKAALSLKKGEVSDDFRRIKIDCG